MMNEKSTFLHVVMISSEEIRFPLKGKLLSDQYVNSNVLFEYVYLRGHILLDQ